MTEYYVVYLLCHVLRTYTMFKFMCIFFDRDEINKKLEFISVIAYYNIVAVAYLIFNNPTLTVAVNIVTLLVITLNYNTTYKRRIFAILYTYAMLILIEFAVFWGIQIISITRNLSQNTQMIIMQILTTMVTYIVVLLLSNLKAIKNSEEVSMIRWIATITIPTITTILSLTPLLLKIEVGLPLLSLIIIAMFFVNIVVFYLYDELLNSSQVKMENELILQQNNAYEKQLNLIYQSQENISIFRHDMKNHLHTLQRFIYDNNNKDALSYIDNTFEMLCSKFEYCKSGNYAVDSILNYKINQGVNQGIHINARLAIPDKLNIHSFDLNVILGNLMDNAINGALKSLEKYIDVSLHYDCGVIFIEITNSYDGIIKMRNNNLISTNKNSSTHGMGISSVKRSINKYNGEIKFNYDEKCFTANLMIFNVSHDN